MKSLRGAPAALGNCQGWPLLRLRDCLSRRKAVGQATLPLLSVNLAGVRQRDSDDGRMAASADRSAYVVVEPDDIVMNPLGKPHGPVGRSDWLGITSPAYWVLRVDPYEADPRFVHHLLRSGHMLAEYKRLGKDLPPNQFDLGWADFRDIAVPLSSLSEQRRIADFLDDQVALLDRAIHLRQQQIDLLDERAFARAYAAVMGLQEVGEREAVSTEWIGSVPATWSVQPLGRLVDIQLGKMLSPERAAGEYLRPYLRNTNVQWDRIDVHDLNVMDFPPSEHSRYEVVPGDLLVCEGGEVGRAAIWNGEVTEMYYQKALHRLRPTSSTSARWVFYVLRVATSLGVFSTGGSSTIAHLTGEQLRAQRMPFPPSDVEQRLVAKLDADAERESRLRSLYNRQVALLRERKQALITAAVTGQFDVATARKVEVA